jgi:hypothetical protein
MLPLIVLMGCGNALETPEPRAMGVLQAGLTQGTLTKAGIDHAVPLLAGERLRLGVLSTDHAVRVLVRGSGGTVAEASSDVGSMQAARIDFTAPSDDTYTLGIRGSGGGDGGAYTVLNRRLLTGTVCGQLQALDVEDAWSLDGADHAQPNEHLRTRSLLDVMPWADECTVKRLQMDVGPSCEMSRPTEDAARVTFTIVSAEFRGCHAGWDLQDELSEDTEEILAEKDGRFHFLRLRDNHEAGWQVSVGALPSGD